MENNVRNEADVDLSSQPTPIPINSEQQDDSENDEPFQRDSEQVEQSQSQRMERILNSSLKTTGQGPQIDSIETNCWHKFRPSRKDSPYAWIVCFGAFLVYASVYGTNGNFTLLYITLHEAFKNETITVGVIAAVNTTKQSANSDNNPVTFRVSLIHSLTECGLYISSIFSYRIIKYLKLRPAAIIGVILAAGGTILAGFCGTNVIWIWWISYGLMRGLGGGLLYVCSVRALAEHFNLKFGLSYGIVSTGTTITYMIYPLLWEAILRQKEQNSLPSYELWNCLRNLMVVIAGTYIVLIIPIMLWVHLVQEKIPNEHALTNENAELLAETKPNRAPIRKVLISESSDIPTRECNRPENLIETASISDKTIHSASNKREPMKGKIKMRKGDRIGNTHISLPILLKLVNGRVLRNKSLLIILLCNALAAFGSCTPDLLMMDLV